jgi:hypothetical protein
MDIQTLRRPDLTQACVAILLAGMNLAGCHNPMPDPAVRHIAFGDSTAAGPASRQYWEFLRDDLGLLADSFAGQGKGGEPTDKGLDRLRSVLDSGLYPNAQVLLYWQGGNDLIVFVKNHDPLLVFSPLAADYPFAGDLATSLDTTQANTEEAIRRGHQAGLTVYVATYFYLNAQTGQCKPAMLGVLLPSQQVLVTEYIRLLNDRIRLAAGNAGAILVDVGAQAETIAAEPANYFDCNHLSEKGNEIVAGVFRTAIQSLP